MRIQAFLLSIIILISVLIGSRHGLPQRDSSASHGVAREIRSYLTGLPISFSEKEPEPPGDSASLFLKDFYAVVSEKTSEGFNQNLSVLNQNFSLLTHILLKLKLKNNFPNNSRGNSSGPEFHSERAMALLSENKMSPVVPLCQPDQSVISSKAILIKYLNYNFNVFDLNPEKRWPIASLTKLMTSLVAIEKIDLNKEVVMTEKAVSSDGVSGNFKAGEVFKLGDLIKAMLVVSSNDAAMAISDVLGEKNFINEMQRKATELKMFQTTYLEPTGLSFINQSTVNDLAKLVNYIYKEHPEIFEISRQKEIEILELKSNKPRKLLTVNKFAGQPDFIGGKTGYIEEGGRNLIALFNINSKTVLTITLGAEDSFAETEKLKKIIEGCSDFTPEP